MSSATVSSTEIPLWTTDNSDTFNEAFTYHKPWANPGPGGGYLTQLDAPDDEEAFEEWVATYDVPYDVASLISNYDMRGYWLENVKGTSKGWTTDRLPDRWLTPYSTMFSARSIYAKPGCPYHWHGDKLIDENGGQTLFWAAYITPRNAAVDYIEKSKIDPNAAAKGLMGEDLDMQAVRLYISGKLKLKVDDQILDAETNRTIEGTSTLTLTLLDDDRTILRSGLLSNKLDIEIDGLWWRLTQVQKQGDQLTLTFDTREIAILRLYNEIIEQQRTGDNTRAEFILRMIREPKGIHIPVIIPALHKVQAVEGTPNASTIPDNPTGMGIPDDLPKASNIWDLITDPRRGLTVKGTRARKDQVDNVNTILATGIDQGAVRKVLVASIMTATQENSITNTPGKPVGDHMENVGIFQQDSRYWPATGDVATDAGAFFRTAIRINRETPNLSYNDLCQEVQHSGFPYAYGQWKGEAENWVTAYTLQPPTEATTVNGTPVQLPGNPQSPVADSGGGTKPATGGTQDSAFYFYRGIPGATAADWKKEDSWTCIGRLADEVHWRAFFVGGTFWYVDDDYLFSRKPLMTITESTAGIDKIEFDYDSNKKQGIITLTVRIGRWIAQPGAVVVVKDMGPVNGKWLVNEFTRSLFDLTATIILKKPLPDLKEPNTANQPPEIPGVAKPAAPGPVFGGTPGMNDGTRAAIVAVAKKALALQESGNGYNYEEIRPYPDSLWTEAGHKHGIDCSSFCIMVYKEAGAPDPSGFGFSGFGNSDSIATSTGGVWTPVALPGDIVLYGTNKWDTSHAAIYIGNGNMIGIGSDAGVHNGSDSYRTDKVGYRSFFKS